MLWKHHVRLFTQSIIISRTDEDPGRIESSATINLRGVSTKLYLNLIFTMQSYKKLYMVFQYL